MLENAKLIDPWTQTIGLLDTSSHRTNAIEGAARLRQKVRCMERRFGALVTLIDRQTASTATIAWRDPTRGCFGDQTWRKARARTSGFCAMSGRAIRPGDAVYKPNPRPIPVNADAMILACALMDAAQL